MPVTVDYRKCKGCKTCYNLCPMDVITWNEEFNMPQVTYEEECWHCGICWAECSTRAIDITYPACCV
jgi:adenylylsulfate reductase subunit B